MIKYGATPNTVYPTPGGAVIVSTAGNDTTGAGTLASPYRSIKKAVEQVASGGTIAVRAGSYHEGALYPQDLVSESILIPLAKPGITLQNYNGEEVWLDGSQVQTGWASYDTNKWRAAVAVTLHRSPSNVRGQDVSGYGSFLLEEYPIAHWPEQVLIDGVPQVQVQTQAEVVPGTFFVQGSYPIPTGVDHHAFASTHYVIGTNPTGKEVRIGKLGRALTNASDNFTLRGVGIRRYVCNQADLGAMFANTRAGLMLENVTIEDTSNLGIDLASPGWVIRNCTFLRNGRQAINASNRADGGLLEYSYFEKTNIRRFNYGPSGGNIKFGMAWDSTVRYNKMFDTRGHGIWFDECCYRGRIYGNYMENTYGTGVLYEISSRAFIVDNVIIDNGVNSTDTVRRKPRDGPAIDIKSSSFATIWHNTIIRPEVGIVFSEGYRKPLNADGISWRSTAPQGSVFGQDKGRSAQFYTDAGFTDVWQFYRDEMNWNENGVSMANNVFAGTAGIQTVYSVFISYYCEVGDKTAVQMTGQLNRPNIFARLDGVTPQRVINSVKLGATPGTPGLAVVYFNFTGAGHEGSPSWQATMNDTRSTLTTSNVIGDERQLLLDRNGILASAPVDTPPHEVQSLLNISPFTRVRYGAGDPVVPGAGWQEFRDIRIGEDMALALFIGGVQAWPTV